MKTARGMRVLILVLASATVPALSGAQVSLGLAGGMSFVGPGGFNPLYDERFPNSFSPGFTLTAFAGGSSARRLSLRVEASVSQWSLSRPSDFAGVLCIRNPPPDVCCGICPLNTSQTRVDLASVTANGLLTLTPLNQGAHLYLIGGAGPYYVFQNPTFEQALRLGVGVGIGCTLPMGGGSRVFVEGRYQHLIDAPAQLSWMAPIIVGMRF